jgi:hypothetical protein
LKEKATGICGDAFFCVFFRLWTETPDITLEQAQKRTIEFFNGPLPVGQEFLSFSALWRAMPGCPPEKIGDLMSIIGDKDLTFNDLLKQHVSSSVPSAEGIDVAPLPCCDQCFKKCYDAHPEWNMPPNGKWPDDIYPPNRYVLRVCVVDCIKESGCHDYYGNVLQMFCTGGVDATPKNANYQTYQPIYLFRNGKWIFQICDKSGKVLWL